MLAPRGGDLGGVGAGGGEVEGVRVGNELGAAVSPRTVRNIILCAAWGGGDGCLSAPLERALEGLPPEG